MQSYFSSSCFILFYFGGKSILSAVTETGAPKDIYVTIS